MAEQALALQTNPRCKGAEYARPGDPRPACRTSEAAAFTKQGNHSSGFKLNVMKKL